MTSRAILGLLAVLTAATPAAAQSALALDVSNGVVTLDARDVPVTHILERWSRLAAITVVNSEKLTDIRVTMRFDAVTPRQALDLLLRDAGGYIAATRASRTGVGTELDRIVIVARSGAQPAASQRTAARSDRRTSEVAAIAADSEASVSADADAVPGQTTPGSSADREEDARADSRMPSSGGAALGLSSSSPPPINGGGPEPLINGLTLDQIRANGVRRAGDAPAAPKDMNTYAAQELERAAQAAAAAAEAAKSGPYDVKGAAAQPGAVAQPSNGSRPPSQAPPSPRR